MKLYSSIGPNPRVVGEFITARPEDQHICLVPNR